MSADDHRPRDSSGKEGVPGAAAIGGGADVVSLLPPPSNACLDGLDARASGLAAFVANQADVLAPNAQRLEQPSAGSVSVPVEILRASRARQARRRQVRRGVGAGVALGALAAAGFVAWTAAPRPPATLSYTVDGAAPPPGGYVRSSPGHEPELAFSDGTNIRVLPSTGARVVDVGTRGARLILEDGRAHVNVAHRPGADWQLQAGAFAIHVHGTAFLVAWNAAQSRLDLQMESGVVSVDGPRSGDTVTVRGGESLSVRLDGSRMVAIAQPPPAARAAGVSGSQEVPVPAEAPSPLDPVAPTNATRAAPGAAPLSARWPERLADGDAAGILADAQRRGIASVLADGSSEELAALADAARFRTQDALARRVMLAQRHRFAGTLRAEEASFLLGRLADGPGGRASDALAWYERYLREAPSGGYAAEAMGRMMLVLERQHRTNQARDVAVAYLRRFPQGVYARAARALASSDER
jgi:ferric-dicitrate binding protein FerR (iron transport regulator)